MAWNVDQTTDGRDLLDRLAPDYPNLAPTLTERLPRQLPPNTTDATFMAAGCAIVTGLNRVAAMVHGDNLKTLFEQRRHYAPPDRPHSYIFDERAKEPRMPLPEGYVPITQQGTGYFYPDEAGLDMEDAEGAEGVIASTMNYKEGGTHIISGRMCAMPRSRRRSALMLSAPC